MILVIAALQEKYKDVAEHLIYIALESVEFEEDKASQILQTMLKENTENANNAQVFCNISNLYYLLI